MGRVVTQQQIEEASLAMEDQMELHELQESLAFLRENLEYLQTHATRINLPTYIKMKAAEKAAVAAIERIISSRRAYGPEMPQKIEEKPVRKLRFRKGVGGPCQERSRAYLRVVRR